MTQPEHRAQFERDVGCLVGRSVLGVRYWDVHDFGDEPRVWDYGDWHRAVLGVELRTDAGLCTVTWTNRFYPYGIEVFPEPIENHLRLGPGGPEGWDVEDSTRWRPILGRSVREVSVFWEHLEVGPAVRQSDGVQVAPATAYDVPVGLRLDIDETPVWFVAGTPQWPDMDQVFVMGDEIIVAFESDRLQTIGFPDEEFTQSSRSDSR